MEARGFANRITPLSFFPTWNTLDVLCYREYGWGCRKGEEYFEQQQRVFDQNLSKGLVAPLWPAFRIGITCHCDQNVYPGYEY